MTYKAVVIKGEDKVDPDPVKINSNKSEEIIWCSEVDEEYTIEFDKHDMFGKNSITVDAKEWKSSGPLKNGTRGEICNYLAYPTRKGKTAAADPQIIIDP
ncbi:MAG TPA: hypothetical protein VGQ71_13935 [Terriglobales bacterium]|nr:hypothetical protein [Terriglobales bacterium]